MTRVTFVEADGREHTLEVANGWSLMQAAVSHGIDGIVGECGGSCSCGTCHCYVDAADLARLPAPDAAELAMLDFVTAERQPGSRLACQLRASPAINGLVVRLPHSQT